jgi:flagellar motor switch protein FliM
MSDAVSVEESQPEVSDGVSTGDVVMYSSAGVRRVAPASLVREYNFRQPGFLSPRDANQYNSHHQKYSQNLAARLATFLRVELTCESSTVRCETVPFRSFCDAVAQPTHLSVFQFEGLEGAGVLEVRPKTSIALANRLLGGQGVLAGEGERSPTEIEVALLDELVLMILKEWIDSFGGPKSYAPRILAHETGCRFLQIAADDCPFFVFKGEFKFGELSEILQLSVPFSMVEHLAGRSPAAAPSPVSEVRQKPLHWRSPYASIEVPITAEWQVRMISLGEAAALSVGDLVQLPQELIDQTRIKVSDGDEFFGTIGVEEGRLAVHLNDRIQKE